MLCGRRLANCFGISSRESGKSLVPEPPHKILIVICPLCDDFWDLIGVL